MKHTLLATLLVVAMPSLAERHNYEEESTVGIYYGLVTDHVFQAKDEDELNENNDVVVLQYNRWNVGTFRNSHFGRSHVVAWEFYGGRANWRNAYIDGRFAVGGATGYSGDAPTVLGIAPSVLVSMDLGIEQDQFEYGVRTYYTLPNVVNAGLFINFRY